MLRVFFVLMHSLVAIVIKARVQKYQQIKIPLGKANLRLIHVLVFFVSCTISMADALENIKLTVDIHFYGNLEYEALYACGSNSYFDVLHDRCWIDSGITYHFHRLGIDIVSGELYRRSVKNSNIKKPGRTGSVINVLEYGNDSFKYQAWK